jgi:hypothetical protein
MAFLAVKMKGKDQSMHLALFPFGIMADAAFLNRIPFLPDIFPVLIVMVAVVAFNGIVFHVD